MWRAASGACDQKSFRLGGEAWERVMPHRRDLARDREVGLHLAAARRAHGFSQEAIALILDVTARQVSNLEKGRSSLSALRLSQLAKLYGITVGQLLEWPLAAVACWCCCHVL